MKSENDKKKTENPRIFKNLAICSLCIYECVGRAQCIHDIQVHVCMYIHVYPGACMYVHTCVFGCMCDVYTCVSGFMCVCTYMQSSKDRLGCHSSKQSTLDFLVY